MTQSGLGAERVLPADRFHTGVRLVSMLAWFGLIVLLFLVLRVVAAAVLGEVAGVSVLLLGLLALLLAQPLAWLLERQLIRLWPSGRAARLEPGQLHWHDRAEAARLDLQQKVNYWRWRFEVVRRRGGRVPSGHHCLAIRLVQGDTVLSLYAFLAPPAAEALAARFPFYELRRPNDKGQQALGGRDAVFLAAEHARWEGGAELEPADFEALLNHLQAHLPEFSRSAASGA